MTDPTGGNTDAGESVRDRQLSALLNSAKEMHSAALAARLDFVAYLAEMTVLQIEHEIEQRTEASS